MSPCKNEGQCEAVGGRAYRCRCFEGFSGFNCEVPNSMYLGEQFPKRFEIKKLKYNSVWYSLIHKKKPLFKDDIDRMKIISKWQKKKFAYNKNPYFVVIYQGLVCPPQYQPETCACDPVSPVQCFGAKFIGDICQTKSGIVRCLAKFL